MRANPSNIRYDDLAKVCEHYFGPPRTTGGSHAVFKTPWPGDPRVNIQNDHGQGLPSPAGPGGHRQEGGEPMTTTLPDITHYTYRVTWSAEDGEFVATCLEFPSLSWLATTQDGALHGLRDVVRDVVQDLHASGDPIPEPLSSRTYSGKFNLRVGERLHRKLALEAAQEHLSLNQYVVRRLGDAS